MREIRQSGSVRGVRRNLYPYRDDRCFGVVVLACGCESVRLRAAQKNKTVRILFGPGPPGFKIGCV
jgi:hypothetical protein